MKCLIVDARSFRHKDKYTGEMVDAISLDVVGINLSNASGKCVLSPYIGKKSQLVLYNTIMASCNDDVTKLNDTLCYIEFDNKKHVVGFEPIETDEPAVIWGF